MESECSHPSTAGKHILLPPPSCLHYRAALPGHVTGPPPRAALTAQLQRHPDTQTRCAVGSELAPAGVKACKTIRGVPPVSCTNTRDVTKSRWKQDACTLSHVRSHATDKCRSLGEVRWLVCSGWGLVGTSREQRLGAPWVRGPYPPRRPWAMRLWVCQRGAVLWGRRSNHASMWYQESTAHRPRPFRGLTEDRRLGDQGHDLENVGRPAPFPS